MFIDWHSRDLKDFKNLLNAEPNIMGEIKRVPSGYALGTEFVTLTASLTEFTLSVNSRVVKRSDIPKLVKWPIADVMLRLQCRKLVSVTVPSGLTKIKSMRLPFRNIRIAEVSGSYPNEIEIVGELVQVLHVLGYYEANGELDISTLTIETPTFNEAHLYVRELTEFKRSEGVFLLDRNVVYSHINSELAKEFPEGVEVCWDSPDSSIGVSQPFDLSKAYGLDSLSVSDFRYIVQAEFPDSPALLVRVGDGIKLNGAPIYKDTK